MNSLELIKERFKEDAFAKLLGIRMDRLTEETVKMHMRLTPDMNNFHRIPHGAAIFALADAAFSVLGNNMNNISVALNCSINYLSSPKPDGILHVEGKLIKQTRRIGTYSFEIYTMEGDSKQIVATMTSTLYRTGKPFDPELEIK